MLLAFVEKGLERDEAYRIVQRNALAAWEGDRHLHELLAVDPDVTLSDDELAGCFSPDRFLENAGVVFERLEAVDRECRTDDVDIADAGLAPGLRIHDLRHTWARWQVMAGTGLQELMELGGWKSYEAEPRLMVRREEGDTDGPGAEGP